MQETGERAIIPSLPHQSIQCLLILCLPLEGERPSVFHVSVDEDVVGSLEDGSEVHHTMGQMC